MSFFTWFTSLFRGNAETKGGSANGLSSPVGVPAPSSFKVGPLVISQAAVDLIVYYEVGDRSYYHKRLAKPSWPGAASGVTIGFGYDLGYNKPATIRADWSKLPPSQRDDLARLAGVKGKAASGLTGSVSHISIPWDAAEDVFRQRTLPRYAGEAFNAFPGLTKCHPHVQGALLSLVFNRGPALTGTNRQDMADIHRILKDGVQQGDYQAIANELRQMKAIWKGRGLDGLLKRREAEAKLVESAIGS